MMSERRRRATSVAPAILSISGIRRDLIANNDWQFQSMEISYCQFMRNIELPAGDELFISSEYENGMLMIHVSMEGKRR